MKTGTAKFVVSMMMMMVTLLLSNCLVSHHHQHHPHHEQQQQEQDQPLISPVQHVNAVKQGDPSMITEALSRLPQLGIPLLSKVNFVVPFLKKYIGEGCDQEVKKLGKAAELMSKTKENEDLNGEDLTKVLCTLGDKCSKQVLDGVKTLLESSQMVKNIAVKQLGDSGQDPAQLIDMALMYYNIACSKTDAVVEGLEEELEKEKENAEERDEKFDDYDKGEKEFAARKRREREEKQEKEQQQEQKEEDTSEDEL